ncbi:hypothetical protein DFH09DRAFT_1095545 [Mycena vulgaris]|nr:hypothetical protein DFH09DRAFT_1095545 [Mycena vulgaris]
MYWAYKSSAGKLPSSKNIFEECTAARSAHPKLGARGQSRKSQLKATISRPTPAHTAAPAPAQRPRYRASWTGARLPASAALRRCCSGWTPPCLPVPRGAGRARRPSVRGSGRRGAFLSSLFAANLVPTSIFPVLERKLSVHDARGRFGSARRPNATASLLARYIHPTATIPGASRCIQSPPSIHSQGAYPDGPASKIRGTQTNEEFAEKRESGERKTGAAASWERHRKFRKNRWIVARKTGARRNQDDERLTGSEEERNGRDGARKHKETLPDSARPSAPHATLGIGVAWLGARTGWEVDDAPVAAHSLRRAALVVTSTGPASPAPTSAIADVAAAALRIPDVRPTQALRQYFSYPCAALEPCAAPEDSDLRKGAFVLFPNAEDGANADAEQTISGWRPGWCCGDEHAAVREEYRGEGRGDAEDREKTIIDMECEVGLTKQEAKENGTEGNEEQCTHPSMGTSTSELRATSMTAGGIATITGWETERSEELSTHRETEIPGKEQEPELKGAQ